MSSEKTEKPTHKKLEDSRDQGQVAHTPAIGKIVALAAGFEIIIAYRDEWRETFQQWIEHAVRHAATADGTAPYYLMGVVGEPVAQSALVLSIIVVGLASVIAIAASLFQVGVHAAPAGIVRGQALDPVSNAKNMFSMQQLMTLLLSIIKVIVIGICTVVALYQSFGALMHSAQGTLDQAFAACIEVIVFVERTSLTALLVFAAIDYIVARVEFMKQMKMSKEDIEREKKDQYGDKHVRQRRKRMSKEMLSDQPVQQTKKANAIITNPTHFAVALRFHPDECPLPVVMARGANETAQAMIRVGREGGIPIIRSVWLARTLFSVGREGQVIPRVALAATAAVYKAIVEVIEQGKDFEQVIELDAGEPPPEET